jgi:hypothetical protein
VGHTGFITVARHTPVLPRSGEEGDPEND